MEQQPHRACEQTKLKQKQGVSLLNRNYQSMLYVSLRKLMLSSITCEKKMQKWSRRKNYQKQNDAWFLFLHTRNAEL